MHPGGFAPPQVGLPGWITRPVRLATGKLEFDRNFSEILAAGCSGLLGTWTLLLLGRFPKNRSQPLHQPLRISKGWREEVWVRGGKEWGVIKEEIGVLGESETPSGVLLGYRDS